ncbi:MAG: phospholipid carrier-dependent glycosyltransferase [Pyrinomonadaceae bacterium]
MGKKRQIIFLLLLAVTLTVRLCVAHYLATDEPNDGTVYAQLARNVLEHRGYSLAPEPPYDPTLIRLPGYPLFIAAVYAVCGHGNNAAVRVAQAFIDTASCALVALLAFLWQPVAVRKWRAAACALALACACPFVVIYAATILTETLTTFLALALACAATLALKSRRVRVRLSWWALAGLCAGAATLVRPDSGLFAAGVGLTLVVVQLCGARGGGEQKSDAGGLAGGFARRFAGVLILGALFASVCALVLVPWTLRNKRVFHLFQPLAPVYANMPDEFVTRGYFRWVRTWIDDERYIEPVLWTIDDKPITVEQMPDKAFDSPDERARVAALLDRYNHPPPEASDDSDDEAGDESGVETTDSGKDQSDDDKAKTGEGDKDESKSDQGKSDEPSNAAPDSGEEQASADQSSAADQTSVEMTPEIDAGFAQLADERVRRVPLRYYAWLPLKRAAALWFDTHSQYYPFSGELFPLDDLDYDERQQYWLPLFAALTWGYTILGAAGCWTLWHERRTGAWAWLLLALLLTVPRLAFMSSLENPEPRYVVELFVFLAALGGIALSGFRANAPVRTSSPGARRVASAADGA